MARAVRASGFDVTEVIVEDRPGIWYLAARWAKWAHLPVKVFPYHGNYHYDQVMHTHLADMVNYAGPSGGLITIWSGGNIQRMPLLEKYARRAGLRVFHVPTANARGPDYVRRRKVPITASRSKVRRRGGST